MAKKRDVSQRKGKSLPVQRIPDLDRQTKLPNPGAPAAPETLWKLLHPDVDQLAVVTPVLPDHHRVVLEASRAARHLLKSAKFSALLASMVGFRRAYAVAYRELQELVAAKKEQWPAEAPFPPVEDFLVQTAIFEALKPFSEHQLIRDVVETVLPWLAGIVDEHTAADAKAVEEDRREAEEARRTRDLPLGVAHTLADSKPAWLARGMSLVLVGWRNAVLWVLDKICASVSADGGMVVRLMETAPRHQEQERNLVRIGGSAWALCARNDRSFLVCLGAHVVEKLSAPLDLLVCDHLTAAYPEGFFGRLDGARGGDAHKTFRKWCDHAGAGFVGGICLANEVDLAGPEFEQLRTFALLRAVRVEPIFDEAHQHRYRVILGDHAEVWEVDAAVLDAYGSTLTLPAGVPTEGT